MTNPIFRADLAVAEPPTASISEPPLFDVHVNIGVTDSANLSFGRQSGEQYLALMAASGIARACAFPPLLGDYRAANVDLRAWAAATNGRILPFARLGGVRGPRPLREPWQARRALREFVLRPAADNIDLTGYAGIKLIPHMSGLPGDDVFAQIRERSLPVLIHGGVHSPPAWIERAVLPRVSGQLIIAHLGTFPGDASLLDDAVDLARRRDNVWLDTSGAWLANFITHAAKQVGPKLLFGSDAPMMHPLVAWQHVASAVRPEHGGDALLEQIAYRNAELIFG